jgi:type IX secretion system PorP/SprF family membrane protein
MHLAKTLILFIISTGIVKAQNFNFSQYNYTPQRVNPGINGTQNQMLAVANYRNQQTNADLSFKSSLFHLSYPLVVKKTGRSFGGVSFSTMDDRTGFFGMFSHQSVTGGMSFNVQTGKDQVLSLGFQGIYNIRRISLEGVVTGAQYISGKGYDPALGTGETFDWIKTEYWSYASGVYWRKNDDNGLEAASIGISLFNIYKPTQTLFNKNGEVPSTVLLEGKFTALRRPGYSLMPGLLVSRSVDLTIINLGGTYRYNIPKTENHYLDLGLRYVVGKTTIVTAQYNKENIFFGVSFDATSKHELFSGAAELAVGYRKTITSGFGKLSINKKKKPSKSKKKKTNTSRKKKNSKKKKKNSNTHQSGIKTQPEKKKLTENPVVSNTSLEEKRDVTQIAEEKTEQNKVTEPRHKIEIHKMKSYFEFELNSSELTEESKKELDELIIILNENPHYHIKIIGHTDNSGSHDLNLKLSEKRAHAVRDYLLKHGLQENKIETEGKGAMEPLFPNTSHFFKAKNRRAEFLLVEN